VSQSVANTCGKAISRILSRRCRHATSQYGEARRAHSYYETDKAKSIAAWQEVFGAGFVAPPATTSVASRNIIIVRGKTVVSTERFFDRDLGIPFRLNGHRVQIATP
jgi:hypothetical protein